MIAKIICISIFIVSINAFSDPGTLKKDDVVVKWEWIAKESYPEISDNYILNDTLDYEFYRFPAKNIGYLRVFLPFQTFKQDNNMYLCISSSIDRVIPLLEAEQRYSGTIILTEPNVYLLALAASPQGCISKYKEHKFSRIYGRLDVEYLQSLFKLFNDDTPFEICGFKANANSFLESVSEPFDIEIRPDKNNQYAGKIVYRFNKKYFFVKFESNDQSFLSMVRGTKRVEFTKCERPIS